MYVGIILNETCPVRLWLECYMHVFQIKLKFSYRRVHPRGCRQGCCLCFLIQAFGDISYAFFLAAVITKMLSPKKGKEAPTLCVPKYFRVNVLITDWHILGGGGGHSHTNVLPIHVHQPLKWTLKWRTTLCFICTPNVTSGLQIITLYGVFQLLWCWAWYPGLL